MQGFDIAFYGDSILEHWLGTSQGFGWHDSAAYVAQYGRAFGNESRYSSKVLAIAGTSASECQREPRWCEPRLRAQMHAPMVAQAMTWPTCGGEWDRRALGRACAVHASLAGGASKCTSRDWALPLDLSVHQWLGACERAVQPP